MCTINIHTTIILTVEIICTFLSRMQNQSGSGRTHTLLLCLLNYFLHLGQIVHLQIHHPQIYTWYHLQINRLVPRSISAVVRRFAGSAWWPDLVSMRYCCCCCRSCRLCGHHPETRARPLKIGNRKSPLISKSSIVRVIICSTCEL